jgi:hypothetical protein
VEQNIEKSSTSPAEKKKQQILVPHDFSDACTCAVNYGIMLAQIFRCELTLVHIIPRNAAKKQGGIIEAESAARSRLAGTAANIQNQTGIQTNAYVMQGKTAWIIRNIIERINAIVFIAGLNPVNRSLSHYFSPSNLVSDYRELRIPILVVQNKMPDAGTFRHVILPVDFTKESKEKASWAGYLSKLNHAAVTIIHTEYKDGFFATQLRNNLILIKKLFGTLGTIYDIHKAEKVRYGIDRYGVAYAKMKGAGMIIIMAVKEWGIDDFLLGPPEKKIITNEDQLPVMMINPRDDLFVPCV